MRIWLARFYDSGPQVLPRHSFLDDGGSVERLGANLDSDFWVGYQVAVPIRMGGGSNVGGDDDEAVAVGDVHHWCRAALATPGPCGCQEE
jgi:hypothetical protein